MSTKAKVSARSGVRVSVNPTIIRVPQNTAAPKPTAELDALGTSRASLGVYRWYSPPSSPDLEGRQRTESRLEDTLTRERDEAREHIDALEAHFKEQLADEEQTHFKRDMAELHCINEERDKLSDALAKGTSIALKDAVEAHLKILQEMAQRHRTFPGGYSGAMSVISGSSDGLGKRRRDDSTVLEKPIDLRKKAKSH